MDSLPVEFLHLYEVYSYRHALEVLATGCPIEFTELIDALIRFRISQADLLARS